MACKIRIGWITECKMNNFNIDINKINYEISTTMHQTVFSKNNVEVKYQNDKCIQQVSLTINATS